MFVSAAAGQDWHAEGPRQFIRKDGWLETMLASGERLMAEEAAEDKLARDAAAGGRGPGGFKKVHKELAPQDKPQKLRLRIAGLNRIHIGAAGPGEVCFAEPYVIGRDGKAVPLPVAKAVRSGNAFSHDGAGRRWKPIQWGEQSYTKGFSLRQTELAIDLDGQAEWLELIYGPREGPQKQPAEIWLDWRPVLGEQQVKEAVRQAIWSTAARAFASGGPPRQQRLEELAGIWWKDWRPGDLSELAGRYAAACGENEQARAAKLADDCRGLTQLEAVRDLFFVQHLRARLDLARKTLALVEQSGARPDVAAELAALEKQLPSAEQGKVSARALYSRACELRRRIVLSHPALDFPELLINKRSSRLPGHMCDQYLGRHSQVGSGLVILSDWKSSPKERVLLKGRLPPGGLIHPDLSFDGKRVLFAFASHGDSRPNHLRGYYIHELSLETGEVRQVTGTPGDLMVGQHGRETVLIEDFDPCYLPDGGFAFISTRSQQYGRCHGGRYVPSYTLYRADLDGSQIRPLSFNEANEWGPSMLHDGSIIYCRWDYINRHDTIFQSLWTMRPDGTNTAHHYGNNSPAPCLTGEPRVIPGSSKTVFTAAAHHGQTMGTIVVVDPLLGQDHGRPLIWITPELAFPESSVPPEINSAAMPLPEDRPTGRGGSAATPYPIAEELFLCAYPGRADKAIYLIDTLGGRELIYEDPRIGCMDPIPLRPRPVPPTIPSGVSRPATAKTGVLYVEDVYQCSEPIQRGSIKRLRVNAIISQPTSSAPGRSAVANEIVKKILGTAPVDEDGSVLLEVPANTPMQFQLLDENDMAVMTMRSLVYVQAGERAGCVGCLRPLNTAPSPKPSGLQQMRKLDPPAGPRYDGGFSYARSVQPVLDRYCIGCHGLGKTKTPLYLLGAAGGQAPSYGAIMGKGMLKLAHRNSETYPSRPMDYFSHAGKLAKMLLDGHRDEKGEKRVELDRDSLRRIVEWMDLNGQYYGDYSFNRSEDRRPLPAGETALRKAVEKRFGTELARQPYPALVNIALPEESRILMAPMPIAAGGWGQIADNAFRDRDDPAYREMLELARASITPSEFHDIAGTCGRERCICGNCWVRQGNTARRQSPSADVTTASANHR